MQVGITFFKINLLSYDNKSLGKISDYKSIKNRKHLISTTDE